jgi:uncharacterized protein (TIGR03118 family)
MEFAISRENPTEVIFISEEGTISAWSSRLINHEAVAKIKNKGKAIYKGAAIATMNGAKYLFVANFASSAIEIYDSNFHRAKEIEKIFRPELPEGFSPTDIHNVDGRLVVTYAQKDLSGNRPIPGAGLGIVNIFNTSSGKWIALEQGEWLNAPRGIAKAPRNFGEFADTLLIGNTGSGQIAAYDRETGNFKGILRDGQDLALTVSGLWSFATGNSTASTPDGYIMYSADVAGESDGAFGMVTPLP